MRRRRYRHCEECGEQGPCLLPMDGKEYCDRCWRARGGPERDAQLRRRITQEFPVQGKLF
jgi:hypothetical protein